jgi:hypothetical protein
VHAERVDERFPSSGSYTSVSNRERFRSDDTSHFNVIAAFGIPPLLGALIAGILLQKIPMVDHSFFYQVSPFFWETIQTVSYVPSCLCRRPRSTPTRCTSPSSQPWSTLGFRHASGVGFVPQLRFGDRLPGHCHPRSWTSLLSPGSRYALASQITVEIICCYLRFLNGPVCILLRLVSGRSGFF